LRSTIKDVAKLAGVSASTVSLALNYPDSSISGPTRDIVKRAADELNYRPNRLAVSLVTKKTNTIGLIIPDNRNNLQAAFSGQIETAAAGRGYSITFGITHNGVTRTIHHLHDFSDRGVDGIIMTQSIFSEPDETAMCLNAIEELRAPIVLTDRIPESFGKDMVKINDFKGGYEAVKYLLDIGHRRIGLITGPMKLYNCVKRMEGCKKAFEDMGMPFDVAPVYEGDFQLSTGMDALPYLLGKNVTAVFAFNDMIAYGVYKGARGYGVDIPGDLSVVGFDDIFFSDIIYPPLTTMEYPIKDMAAAVIRLLSEQIDCFEHGPARAPQTVTYDPVLKVRGSAKRMIV
jgi:LacI family transcriptional regulator